MHTPGVLGPSHLRDAIFASDPERARLHQAFRVTLTAMIATLVLDGIAEAIDRPLSVGLVGINVAMLASAVINDPTPREQQITLACAPIVASAAIAAGTYSAPHEVLRTTVLLALVFIAVLARRHGPRGLALGTISMLACFFALFFRAAPNELPLMIAGVFVASGLGYLVRFWLLRDRPGALRRRRIEGLRNIIALTIEHAASAVASGGRSRDALQHIAAVRHNLGRINEAALALEELPSAPDDARVLTVELATQTLVLAVRRWLESAPETLHRGVANTLTKTAEHIRDDDTTTLDRARQELADQRDPPTIWLHDALAALLTAVRDLQAPASDPSTFFVPPPPPPPPPTLRPAIQATVAAALALLLGGLVSHDRAFWAVLAAFMVFTRANTLGAMLVRAWQRTVGTVAGVVVGLLVAEAAHGHTYLELGLVFVCMFVAYYSLQAAYTWMVGAFTTLVAVLYSLLGNFSPELLYLRVLETVVGASVGAVVAAVVFPTPTRPAIRNAMIDALTTLAEHLELARREPPGAQLRASARAIDRKLRDLRAEVTRAAVGPWLRSARDRAHLFLTFATVFFHARPLTTHNFAADPESPLQDLLRGLADNVRAVADRLAGRPGPHLRPLGAAIEAAHDTARTPALDSTLLWLTDLDDALVALDRDIIELGWSGPIQP